MKLKAKITVGYLTVVLVTILFSVIAIQNYTRVVVMYEETTNKYQSITSTMHELSYRTLQRQSGLHGFLLTGKTRYLVSYDENILPIKTLIGKARNLNPSAKDYNAIIEKYEKLVKEWEDNIAEEAKGRRQQLDYGLIDYGQYIESIAEIDQLGRSILRELKIVEDQLVRIIERELSNNSQLTTRSGQSTKNLLIVVAVLSIGGSFAFGAFLANHITSALDGVVRAAQVISRGDLSHRVPHTGTKDEVAFLAHSFNEMAHQLEGKIRELTESEKKYSTLVENADDGIIIIQNEIFVFANRAFCKIMGYGLDEVIGMHYLSIASPDSVSLLRERHVKRLRGEEVEGITEGDFIDKNGETWHLEVNAALIEYENQKAVLVIFRDISERKEYETSLKKLSERVMKVQEKERKRISLELHDEIGQALSAMSISLELLQRDGNVSATEYNQKLDDVKKLVEKTVDDVHRISYNLRPYLLDNFGLVSALRWYTENYAKRSGTEVALQVEGEWEKLPPVLETAIYRVVQEALTNVSKHAKASRVFISISYCPASIAIQIEDNGCGFEVEKQVRKGVLIQGGLGLFGITERVSAFGGTFSIGSKKGAGTRLSIRVPTTDFTKDGDEENG